SYRPTSGNQKACSKACGAKLGPYQAKPRPAIEKPALPDKPSGPTHLSSSQLDGAKARARLYRELLAFIQQGKGWVTGEPGCSPLRFESVDSSLADQLRDAGHRVSHIGQGERLTGFAGFQKTRDRVLHYAGPVKTLVFEIQLGGSYPPTDYKHGIHFK